MQILTRRPALRWFAPLALVLAVGGTGIVAATADADPRLAPKTAEQLLVDLQGAEVDGLSGTVVQKAELGLPALPSVGGADTSQLTSLLSGSHTLRVWYAGPEKARFALLDKALGETDVIVDGTQLWTWSSQENEATRRTLPEPSSDQRRVQAPETPLTPQQAADKALAALGSSTVVSTDSTVKVAGRPARELVLRPKPEDTAGSLITAVRIAVDDVTSTPLRVQVLGTGGTTVAEVGFESVDFAVPDDQQFRFNPPKGATVTEKGTVDVPQARKPSAADREAAQQQAEEAKAATTVVGQGWTSVVVTKVPADAASGQLGAFLNTLTPVPDHAGWRLLAGTAFSAVLTDDGRLAVGAVQPQLLYDALAK